MNNILFILLLALSSAAAVRRSPVNFVAGQIRDMDREGFVGFGMPHLEHHKEDVEEIKSVSRPSETKNDKKMMKKQEQENNADDDRKPIAFGLGQMYVPSELIGHE